MLTLGALALAGCGSSFASEGTGEAAAPSVGCELPPGPVVIAGVGRSNMPGLELTPGVTAVIDHAAETQATAIVVDTDGDPSKMGEVSFGLEKSNDRHEAAELEKRKAELHSGLATASPDVAQTDALGAVDEALRYIKSGTDAGSGTLVLIDSGLSTTGVLDYTTDGMLLAEPAEIADYVVSGNHLGDLSGVAVVLVGIGDTAPPQQPLDAATRKRLTQQWRTALEAAGAECVAVDETPLSAEPASGLPPVATVEVPVAEPFTPESPEPYRLGTDKVAFVSDSDEFIDPAAARSALAPISGHLVEANSCATITGTAASWGSRQYRLDLSARRAQAVADELTDLGVPVNRLTVEGVGTDHPEHVPDLDAQGNLLPAPAAQNRAVFVAVGGSC